MTATHPLYEQIVAARDNASVVIQQLTGADIHRADCARDLITLFVVGNHDNIAFTAGVFLALSAAAGEDNAHRVTAATVRAVVSAVREYDSIISHLRHAD